MRPGDDCMQCHDSGGEPAFSVAGTVFTSATASSTDGMSDATVVITDSAGMTVRLTTNSVGNFYSSAALTFPIRASIERAGGTTTMAEQVSTGSCASCHESAGSPGRVFVNP